MYHGRDVASVAEPAVCPVGHHVDVSGDIFVRNAVKHVSDDRGGFGN